MSKKRTRRRPQASKRARLIGRQAPKPVAIPPAPLRAASRRPEVTR